MTKMQLEISENFRCSRIKGSFKNPRKMLHIVMLCMYHLLCDFKRKIQCCKNWVYILLRNFKNLSLCPWMSMSISRFCGIKRPPPPPVRSWQTTPLSSADVLYGCPYALISWLIFSFENTFISYVQYIIINSSVNYWYLTIHKTHVIVY